MGQVETFFKANQGACEGVRERCTGDNCPIFGTLGPAGRDGRRRVRGCDDPSARGRRSNKSGRRRQNQAAKALGILSLRNEEQWASVFANEVKSGKQVGPAWTWWVKAEAQVRASEPDHGNRAKPVRVVLKPPGTRDGVVMVRESTWADLITPALLEYYGEG